MNIVFCDKQCPIGKKARTKFLARNNSAYDAAIDFNFFVNECFKTCPYKDKHSIEPIDRNN